MSLDSLALDAAHTEAESPGFMEPGTKVKKGRGRPKGSAKKEESSPLNGAHPPPMPPTDPLLELKPLTDQLTLFYSGMLVQIAEDEKAALSPTNIQIMSHSTAACMNQYFPNAIGAHASLIVLLLVVGQTSMTAFRLRAENLEKYREEKRQQDKNINVQ